MYRRRDDHPLFDNFLLPFDGKLDPENRWVRLSKLIPWDLLEDLYGSKLSNGMGRPGKNVRVAFGARIIKHKLNLSDEEVVEQIRENPYPQFFIGFEEFRPEPPFDSSLMTTFRKRFNLEDVFDINDLVEERVRLLTDKALKSSGEEDSDDDKGNSGKLIVDATVAPADIKYPTDLSLLNEAREEAERLVDELWSETSRERKPRTYRKKARKSYLAVSKKRRPRAKLSASLVDGIARIDRPSWDAYNESEDLVSQVEAYKKRNGFHPASVHADGIYGTRANRAYLKSRGIRFSGKLLGRPPKETGENKLELKEKRAQARRDEMDKIPVEGKFGQGKRKYGLDLIMAKLRDTSETWTGMIILVMNLGKWMVELGGVFSRLFLLSLFTSNRLYATGNGKSEPPTGGISCKTKPLWTICEQVLFRDFHVRGLFQ